MKKAANNSANELLVNFGRELTFRITKKVIETKNIITRGRRIAPLIE